MANSPRRASTVSTLRRPSQLLTSRLMSKVLGLGMVNLSLLSFGLLAPLTAVNLGLMGAIAPRVAQAQSASRNPEIKVGIVQRFGEEKEDKLTLAPLAISSRSALKPAVSRKPSPPTG